MNSNRVQELRRSSAATPIPSKKERKGGGRQGKNNNAMKREMRAG